MADVNCYGSVISTRGSVVPLLRTDLAEGTREAISTDPNFTGSAQVFGTFANQQFANFTVAKAGVEVEQDFTFAVIISAGHIKAALCGGGGAGTSGGTSGLPAPIPYPKHIASGDTLEVRADTAASRATAVSVACTSGEYHVFLCTPSTSGESEYVSILDGQGIGTTLQGRTISHAFALAGANDAELTSPVYLLDGSGVPTGSIGFSASSGDAVAQFQPVRWPVALNSRLVMRTDA